MKLKKPYVHLIRRYNPPGSGENPKYYAHITTYFEHTGYRFVGEPVITESDPGIYTVKLLLSQNEQLRFDYISPLVTSFEINQLIPGASTPIPEPFKLNFQIVDPERPEENSSVGNDVVDNSEAEEDGRPAID